MGKRAYTDVEVTSGAPPYLTLAGSWRPASVHMPNRVPEMGDDVFKGCTSLTSVHVPDSVSVEF